MTIIPLKTEDIKTCLMFDDKFHVVYSCIDVLGMDLGMLCDLFLFEEEQISIFCVYSDDGKFIGLRV